MFVSSAESASVCSSHDVKRKSREVPVPKNGAAYACVPKSVPNLFDDVSENKNTRTDNNKKVLFPRKTGAPPRPSPKNDAENPTRILPFSADEPTKSLWGFPGNQRVLKNALPTRALLR